MFLSLQMLFQNLINILFPSTRFEDYITAVIAGTKDLPVPKIQLIGDGISCFSYKDIIIRKLISRLKYNGDTRIAKVFADALAPILQTYLAQTTLRSPYYITAIPLSRRRTWWRGYNQADLIAVALTNTNQKEFVYAPDILKRTKHTIPQATIKNPVKRLFNARGIFAVTDQMEVTNKVIILIDDVITTGATLREASRVLKSAGAHHVVWFGIAH